MFIFIFRYIKKRVIGGKEIRKKITFGIIVYVLMMIRQVDLSLNVIIAQMNIGVES